MLAVLTIILLQAAAAAPKPAAPLVSIPMTRPAWDSMTDSQRHRYAQVTVDALRRSPEFRRCDALSADMLEVKIAEIATTGEPLIMAVASAAYTICDQTAAN